MSGYPVYIGYDPREADAFDVAAHSIERHSSVPLKVMALDLKELRSEGLYKRTHTLVDGQMIDDADGKPFSTEFSFSRFLVPHLNGYDGWALFADCDWLFTGDIIDLLERADDTKAAMVVKHDYAPKDSIKMDGRAQQAYPRKLWSSLVLWNCAHPDNLRITPELVSYESGSWLHGFSWLQDDKIGELDMDWNWIPGVSPTPYELPRGIHFSLGVPSMRGYEHCEFSELWKRELRMIQASPDYHKERASA